MVTFSVWCHLIWAHFLGHSNRIGRIISLRIEKVNDCFYDKSTVWVLSIYSLNMALRVLMACGLCIDEPNQEESNEYLYRIKYRIQIIYIQLVWGSIFISDYNSLVLVLVFKISGLKITNSAAVWSDVVVFEQILAGDTTVLNIFM